MHHTSMPLFGTLIAFLMLFVGQHRVSDRKVINIKYHSYLTQINLDGFQS